MTEYTGPTSNTVMRSPGSELRKLVDIWELEAEIGSTLQSRAAYRTCATMLRHVFAGLRDDLRPLPEPTCELTDCPWQPTKHYHLTVVLVDESEAAPMSEDDLRWPFPLTGGV